LARSEAPSLAHFVRSLVGMDRSAAQAAFSQFLNDRSLTAQQIRFVELVIDQLTARGVIPPEALYEPPFTRLHHAGPDELFDYASSYFGWRSVFGCKACSQKVPRR
jgi:type I restriction enzyme, R subunit